MASRWWPRRIVLNVAGPLELQGAVLDTHREVFGNTALQVVAQACAVSVIEALVIHDDLSASTGMPLAILGPG